MKHGLTEKDVLEADTHVLNQILEQLGILRYKGYTDNQIKTTLLKEFIGRDVELNQGGEMKPGTRAKQHFALLDWAGRIAGGKDVEGVYEGVWNGQAHVLYRTTDLPRRFQTADEMPEFMSLGHDFEPSPVDVLPD